MEKSVDINAQGEVRGFGLPKLSFISLKPRHRLALNGWGGETWVSGNDCSTAGNFPGSSKPMGNYTCVRSGDSIESSRKLVEYAGQSHKLTNPNRLQVNGSAHVVLGYAFPGL